MSYEIYAGGHNNSQGQLFGFDTKRVEKLCAGETAPITADDRILLKFIGGARPKPWPTKWVKCQLCGVEWQTTAFPNRKGSWWWATICNPCADLWDAGIHSAHPNLMKHARNTQNAVNGSQSVRNPSRSQSVADED